MALQAGSAQQHCALTFGTCAVSEEVFRVCVGLYDRYVSAYRGDGPLATFVEFVSGRFHWDRAVERGCWRYDRDVAGSALGGCAGVCGRCDDALVVAGNSSSLSGHDCVRGAGGSGAVGRVGVVDRGLPVSHDAVNDGVGSCEGDSDGTAAASGMPVAGAVGGMCGVAAGGGSSDAGCASICGDADTVVPVRGKHFERNRARRERARRAKLASANWRAAGAPREGSLPSLAGTVCTVDTRTADEVEAASTLARRRVAENKLAEIRANRLIASYADVDKTAAIEKLQVARLEERINTAKAKSQASYKKCDESLKSLGSTGSAGEFALKKQIKDTKKLEARLQYVHDQFAAVYPLLSQEAIDRANAVPEPKFPTDFEVFGDCPADYTEEEREAYYLDMNIEAGELF